MIDRKAGDCMEYMSAAAEIQELKEILEFVLSKLEETSDRPASRKLRYELRLACEEVLVNIANYAYPRGSGMVTVGCEKRDGRFIIETIDAGIPFNPLTAEDPDICCEMEERSMGGLGLFILKNTMDKITYQRRGEQNVLTMEKSCDGAGPSSRHKEPCGREAK